MKLNSISINNLRCLERLTIKIDNYTSLIGPNNAGKTTVLRGIEIFLNQSKPDIEEWNKNHFDEPIIIEGRFIELEDWERNKPGVASLVYNNEINLKCIATKEGDKVQLNYEAYVAQEEIEGFNGKFSDLSDEIKEIAEGLGFTAQTWRTKSNQERVRQIIREEHPNLITYSDPNWTSEGISIAPALKQAIPQAVIIPAVRDASDESNVTQKTAFGSLLNRVILPAVTEIPEYSTMVEAVEALTAKIRGDNGEEIEAISNLANELTERMQSIINSRVILTMNTPEFSKIVQGNASISLDDGIETKIQYQGHGAQRALIFALIEVLAKRESAIEDEENVNTKCALLLFEEPELYIHPHLLRRLKNALLNISNNNNWQVVISTHSPFMINVASNPKELVIFHRNDRNAPPRITQLIEDPFIGSTERELEREILRALLDFHPSVCEAFFAKRVVLVEGDSELALFQHHNLLLERCNLDIDLFYDTSIVSCSGKWTIVPIARLLNAFNIPTRVVHDVDRKDFSDEELINLPNIHPYKANEKILAVIENNESIFKIDDTLEDILWTGTEKPTSRDKPYRAWLRVKNILEENRLDEFNRLKELVSFTFNW